LLNASDVIAEPLLVVLIDTGLPLKIFMVRGILLKAMFVD